MYIIMMYMVYFVHVHYMYQIMFACHSSTVHIYIYIYDLLHKLSIAANYLRLFLPHHKCAQVAYDLFHQYISLAVGLPIHNIILSVAINSFHMASVCTCKSFF